MFLIRLLAILKEFRRLAGIRGRSCHRPTMPHTDDVKVEVELDKQGRAGLVDGTTSTCARAVSVG